MCGCAFVSNIFLIACNIFLMDCKLHPIRQQKVTLQCEEPTIFRVNVPNPADRLDDCGVEELHFNRKRLTGPDSSAMLVGGREKKGDKDTGMEYSLHYHSFPNLYA